MPSKNKHSLKSVVRKILAAFLLVSVAIFLALTIARFSFRELMGTVDELSEPNEKLTLLNRLFEDITTLDQVQRAEAIRNPHKPYNAFLDQSSSINVMIDSLKTLAWDSSQINRLDEMKQILNERNELFFSYLKVKADLLDNRDFAVQLDTLAAIIQEDRLVVDSTFLTQETKTTTTYLPDTTPGVKKSEQRSFLKKLFSKKRAEPKIDTPLIRIQEETSFMVDTAALAKKKQAVAEIENIMMEMETEQRTQRKNLQRQELELIHSNSLFVNRLLSILHDAEEEELAQIEEKNEHAVSVMNQSLSRFNILMLGFFLAAALLVYLIWIDIGRSNYYKEQLEKARDEAEELTKIKQRFLANMSHEIRTPLQSIIGFAEQLRQKTGSHHEEVDAIYSSSEHLLHIVNEVLDYSRISSGHFSLAKEAFKLLAVVKEIESAIRVQAERKNLTFVLDAENAMEFTLVGDPFRLRQILYNLLGNAVKFTHRGFIKLSVRTRDEGEKVECAFEIIDTGIGISEQDIGKIFNQFEQVETSITKQYGGTGLGLTIVKSLIDAQQGSLEVTSQPGMGSTFRVVLSFEKEKEKEKEKHGTTLRMRYGTNRAATPAKGTVIVVDDDPLILRLCALILGKSNIDFETFSTARAALDYLPGQEISHVFLDIRIPEVNGIELCHRLRKTHSSAQFIALTAHVLPEERQSLLQEGFDIVLCKPFHESELLNILGFGLEAETVEAEEKPNLSGLRKMTMGDEALFQSIVSQFIEETTDDMLLVREYLEGENSKSLREVIHKMSGRFAQIGMLSLGSRLHNLEKKLIAGHQLSDLKAEINTINKNISEVVMKIRLTTLEQLN